MMELPNVAGLSTSVNTSVRLRIVSLGKLERPGTVLTAVCFQ